MLHHITQIPHANYVRHWTLLAIIALAIAGIFSILLVVQRTPQLQDIFQGRDFFHTALTIHVNLSVLVWLLALASAMAAMLYRTHLSGIGTYLAWLGGLGALSMAISPFILHGLPYMNNYVPVYQHPLFIFGLCLFLTSIAAHLLISCCYAKLGKDPFSLTLSVGIYTTSILILLAIFAFLISFHKLKFEGEFFGGLERYYEYLFWDGGHILQIAYTQLICVAWLWIIQELMDEKNVPYRIIQTAFILNVLLTVPVFYLYFLYPVSSAEHVSAMTEHMRWAGGIVAILVSLCLLPRIITLLFTKVDAKYKPVKSALYYSIILFGMGGILGWLISGTNVTIPAHYHGSIVGISVGLMGWVYLFLPKIGYPALTSWVSRWQPHIFGIGQLMHIGGLALSGGYGVLRKDPSSVGGEGMASFYMGIMGLGGLLAIIGGLMFVIPCLLRFLQRK